MRRSRRDGPISREQLEFLAAISPEWRDELHRRDRAAAEAAHRQDVDDFVRAITVPDRSTRGRSPASAETQEFVEAITRPAWPDDRPITREEVDRFVDAITGRIGSTIREAGWDPAKHPRVPGGQPEGGQWTSAGGTRAGSTASRASSANSNTPTTGLASWHPPVGHHWVPFGVVQDKEIRALLSDDAVHYAAGAYSGQLTRTMEI